MDDVWTRYEGAEFFSAGVLHNIVLPGPPRELPLVP